MPESASSAGSELGRKMGDINERSLRGVLIAKLGDHLQRAWPLRTAVELLSLCLTQQEREQLLLTSPPKLLRALQGELRAGSS